MLLHFSYAFQIQELYASLWDTEGDMEGVYDEKFMWLTTNTSNSSPSPSPTSGGTVALRSVWVNPVFASISTACLNWVVVGSDRPRFAKKASSGFCD